MSNTLGYRETQRINLIASCILALILVAVYLSGICPTVYWLDSGEFSASLTCLGLPHSPSFPVFINAHAGLMLIPLGDLAYRANLISVFWMAGAAVTFFFLLLHVLRLQEPERLKVFAVAAYTCAIFTNPLFFFQAHKVEVYSMNLALNLAIIGVLVRLLETDKPIVGKDSRWFYLLTILVALNAGNHLLLSAHLWPAILIVFIIRKRFLSREQFCVVSVFLLLFGSVYLFLPIRSSRNPPMDIGNPEAWMTFINGVTRRGSFERFFGNSSDEWIYNVDRYFQLMQTYMNPWILLGLLVCGILYLIVHYRVATMLWLVVIGNVSITLLNRNFNANPDTGPAYLMISTIVISLFPIALVAEFTRLRPKIARRVRSVFMKEWMIWWSISIGAVTLAVTQFRTSETNLRDDFSAAWIGRAVLDSTQENALVFTGFYSNYRFVLNYLTVSERYRDDVEIIDRGEVLYWPGGLQQLLKKNPDWRELFEGDEKAIDDIEYLGPRGYRHSGIIDRIRAQRLIQTVTARLASRRSLARPVYWFASEDDVLLDSEVSPAGLTLDVSGGRWGTSFGDPWKTLDHVEARSLVRSTEHTNDTTRQDLVESLTNVGNSLDILGQSRAALTVYRRVLSIDPDYDFARLQLSILLQRQRVPSSPGVNRIE